MGTLNLGILAHVDAGKTTLTERLLFAAGVIDEIGTVDRGNTQTDSLALEQKRGITIKSAVVSFVVGGVKINLIDTPGHPDFIAEVESVLDGAVLEVSAVEDVQAQTRVLMRTLKRLGIPTLIFVNKIDRSGARFESLLRGISEKLTPAIVPMGSVGGLGTRGALCSPYDDADPEFFMNCSSYSRTTTMRFWRSTWTARKSHTGGFAGSLRRRRGGPWCIRCSSARRFRERAWVR
jgi:ribosomal protection tetracycline resistance protein